MKGAGWRYEGKGKRKGQATPQKVRQYKKKMKTLAQHLKQSHQSGAKTPDFLLVRLQELGEATPEVG